MNIKSILQDVGSIFIPEKINVEEESIVVSRLGNTINRQSLTELKGIYYSQKHDQAESHVLNIYSGGELASYYSSQVNFPRLVYEVFSRAKVDNQIADELLNSLSKKGDFEWTAENFIWPD